MINIIAVPTKRRLHYLKLMGKANVVNNSRNSKVLYIRDYCTLVSADNNIFFALLKVRNEARRGLFTHGLETSHHILD
jgi:hypothetical protein